MGFQFKFSPSQPEKEGRNHLLLPSLFSGHGDGYRPCSFSSPGWNDLSRITPFHSMDLLLPTPFCGNFASWLKKPL